MFSLWSVLTDVALAFGCLLAVDLITGVLHWAEDTWLAPGRSALLDRWIVRDNIDHHRLPGAIRAGDYWSTNRVCIVIAAGVAATLALFHVHAWEAYLIVALASQSNQVHLWSHCGHPPFAIRALQSVGLLQSRRHHAQHHKRPYANRYCTTTDYINPILDRLNVWRGLEWVVEHCGATVQRATPARSGY